MNPRKRTTWLVVLALVILVLAFIGMSRLNDRGADLREQAGFLPGNPERGGRLFFERGCGECHAISGLGGKQGPDLARVTHSPSDLAEIAAVMWNHAPEMFDLMGDERALQLPRISPVETSDLMAFLFTAGYLEEEGNPKRGEALLVSKRCLQCHTTQGKERKRGPNLAAWSSSVNPILWATLLWNHAPAMEEAMQTEGVSWPQISSEEIVDLLAYLRDVGNVPRKLPPLPGDPWNGKVLFQTHCQSCHKAENEGGEVGPDLGVTGSSERSLSGLAAALWNHAPAMNESMKALGVNRPSFSDQEMADIITYLFAIRYFEAPGMDVAGKEVYARSCSRCHGDSGQGTRMGPSLRSQKGRWNATFMASTLWNHGPRMYEKFRSEGIEWPMFQVNEMRDLIAYLRDLS